eukprot:TRINITY_DN1670_c1_g1_i4.p2 TRINITY_DN1670_c1_g1~~TRINITY_DN1670_c1_g1_i4.p2  ORF type:complete len:348 (-),score=24.89 TRINITY_DN1670_c1_g1_i4:4484-5527(-)
MNSQAGIYEQMQKEFNNGNAVNYPALLTGLIEQINRNSFLKSSQVQHGIPPNNQHTQGGTEESTLTQFGWIEKRQGIVHAEMNAEGAVTLKITAKAAGFVLGPKGSSIRAICAKTGAFTKSWLSCSYKSDENMVPLRVYFVQGTAQAIYETVNIILAAVGRYAALIEGRLKDKKVSGEQTVEGIKFEYKPPPLTLMSRAVRTYREDEGQQNKTIRQNVPIMHERTVPEQTLPQPFSPTPAAPSTQHNGYYPPVSSFSSLPHTVNNQSLPPYNYPQYTSPLPLLLPLSQPNPQPLLQPTQPNWVMGYPQQPIMWYPSSPLPSPTPKETGRHPMVQPVPIAQDAFVQYM